MTTEQERESNVKLFTGITPLDFDADVILNAAKGHLKSVVIIGETEDGDEFFSASVSGGPEILWMLERAKHKLMAIVDEE
jgi:hypothetical protein